MEQRSEEWFNIRKGRVTASSIGAILNMSPFTKPKDVMRRMVRDWHNGRPEFTGNAATDWGNANEAGAIAQFEMNTGTKVEKCAFYQFEDWLGASPDGLVGSKGLIEVKCPYGLRENRKPFFKTAKMQLHYYSQMQIQMYVTDRDSCYFYQWAPYGEDLEIVEFDKSYTDMILKPIRAFYDQYLIERQKPEKYLDEQEIAEIQKAQV